MPLSPTIYVLSNVKILLYSNKFTVIFPKIDLIATPILAVKKEKISEKHLM
jgi:hypothetical protein